MYKCSSDSWIFVCCIKWRAGFREVYRPVGIKKLLISLLWSLDQVPPLLLRRDILERIMKRVNVEIYDELHTKIKKHAVERNISMRLWVTRALIEALKREEQFE
jgi:hypothetical protein